MRRLFILAALVSVLGMSVVTDARTVEARDGEPGDYCSQAPDYPLGWRFNDACRGHDECLDALPDGAAVADRLGCDDAFLDDLLDAPHAVVSMACEEHVFCRALATVYYRVVRYVTVMTGMVEAVGSTRLPAP